MNERTAIEINVETGDKTERPLTDAEIADLEQITVEGAEQMAAYKAKEQQKLAAEAKLAALGLTADDLKALGL
jgi:hypothetical protein